MLGRAVVPDGQVAGGPAPADGVLQPRDVPLEQLEQVAGVRWGHAQDALDELAEHQRALPRLGVDADHRVLGLEDRGQEHLAVMLLVPGRPTAYAAAGLLGVVVFVRVQRPEALGQGPQLRGEALVRGRGVGPAGVAAVGRERHGPQDGDRGRPVDERDVGVPGVGLAPAGLRVQFQDVRLPRGPRDGRVRRGQLAEQAAEARLFRVGQVMLTAEEDHLVLAQGVPDAAEHIARQVRGDTNAGDLRTDVARDAPDVDGRCTGGHGSPLCGAARPVP